MWNIEVSGRQEEDLCTSSLLSEFHQDKTKRCATVCVCVPITNMTVIKYLQWINLLTSLCLSTIIWFSFDIRSLFNVAGIKREFNFYCKRFREMFICLMETLFYFFSSSLEEVYLFSFIYFFFFKKTCPKDKSWLKWSVKNICFIGLIVQRLWWCI